MYMRNKKEIAEVLRKLQFPYDLHAIIIIFNMHIVVLNSQWKALPDIPPYHWYLCCSVKTKDSPVLSSGSQIVKWLVQDIGHERYLDLLWSS